VSSCRVSTFCATRSPELFYALRHFSNGNGGQEKGFVMRL
jgi:hypothetical protein